MLVLVCKSLTWSRPPLVLISCSVARIARVANPSHVLERLKITASGDHRSPLQTEGIHPCPHWHKSSPRSSGRSIVVHRHGAMLMHAASERSVITMSYARDEGDNHGPSLCIQPTPCPGPGAQSWRLGAGPHDL